MAHNPNALFPKLLRPGDVEYLDGLLDAYDELQDGAWSACCQSAIAADPRFKGRDSYEVWIAWVEANSVEQQPQR
jgi:hypothetical protein